MHSSLLFSKILPIIYKPLSYSRIHLLDFLYIFSKEPLNFPEGVLVDHLDLLIFIVYFSLIFLCSGEWNRSATMILAITKIIVSLKMFVAYFDEIIRIFIINKNSFLSKSENILSFAKYSILTSNIDLKANTKKHINNYYE